MIILILCTFFSKTLYNLTLTTVEISTPKWDELPIDLKTEGIVTIENKRDISYNVPLEITAVLAEENSTVKAGDVLFEVNSKEFEIEIQKKELEIRKLNEQLSQWHNYSEREQLNTQLEILEKEMELYKSQTPYSGEICAQSDGIISQIAVSENTFIPAGQSLAKFTEGDQSMSVQFSMNEDEGALCPVGGRVEVSYNQDELINGKMTAEEKKVNMAVTKKIYDPETLQYSFYAEITDEEIHLNEGKKVNVLYELSSQAYNNVISLNAVSVNEYGDTFVYVIRTKEGLFGKESYVEKVYVNQISHNNVNAAITGNDINEYTKIVISSSRALTNGETVRVINNG
ncbi:MAG: biotin/lipoyl-binding protein [Ruminococcus sp.]|nr:biotin/lipoyl-binding protein [Ruminococcus sp.]